MGTGELLAVFAALMAVIAMLGIAVDWVGKPMRSRKFTPRIYRYEDEHLVEVDPGRTPYSSAQFELPAAPVTGVPYVAASGVSDWSESHFVLPQPSSTMETWGLLTTENPVIGDDFDQLVNVDTYDTYERGLVNVETIPMPVPPGRVALTPEELAGPADHFPEPIQEPTQPSSVFDEADLISAPADGLPNELPIPDTLPPAEEPVDPPALKLAPSPDATVDLDAHLVEYAADPGPSPEAAAATVGPVSTFRGLVESAQPTRRPLVSPDKATSEPGVWKPGDPLWSPSRRGTTPSATTVRRRFWQSASVLIPGVHWYGEPNVDRMIEGKPPQRRNRRTGKMESMHLSGLRSATDTELARPHWPSEELDPFEEL